MPFRGQAPSGWRSELFYGLKQKDCPSLHSQQVSFLRPCFLAGIKATRWKLFQESRVSSNAKRLKLDILLAACQADFFIRFQSTRARRD